MVVTTSWILAVNVIILVIYSIIYLIYLIPAIKHLCNQPNLRGYIQETQDAILVIFAIFMATLVLVAIIISLCTNSLVGLLIFILSLLFIWYNKLWVYRSPIRNPERSSDRDF